LEVRSGCRRSSRSRRLAIVVDGPVPPPATATQEEKDKYAKEVADLRKKTLARAKPVEHPLYYSHYRDVDGMKFPFRLRRAIGPDAIEETAFDAFGSTRR
jgi:hypothetical protein